MLVIVVTLRPWGVSGAVPEYIYCLQLVENLQGCDFNSENPP